MSALIIFFGVPSQMRVFDSRSYLRMISSTSASGSACSAISSASAVAASAVFAASSALTAAALAASRASAASFAAATAAESALTFSRSASDESSASFRYASPPKSPTERTAFSTSSIMATSTTTASLSFFRLSNQVKTTLPFYREVAMGSMTPSRPRSKPK